MSELSRLRWLCRRGMKELDMVMSAYLDRHYETATSAEQLQFRMLLEMPDPDLFRLLLGRGQADDAETRRLVEFLRGMSASQ
ncbi:MAG TPA: succinate dehydrogenase assembly factor 2 [Gammaproteobacteria bacterium]|nr:succinate dehydrogenase assembly factor 2 [Gammaproteobacteria bacterium]